MDWEDWLSQRKLTIAFYPFTVSKVTNVGTNWKPIHSFLYTGWQWRNFFISYLCQLFFRHVVGQALRSVSYSDITFLVT